MAEELGKIEKPSVEEFKKGRKLYYIPLLYKSEDVPEDYLEKVNRYWEQVERQITELTFKLGQVNKIFHELITLSGEEGAKTIGELNEGSYKIIQTYMEKKAQLEAVEDNDILTEFMDLGRMVDTMMKELVRRHRCILLVTKEI